MSAHLQKTKETLFGEGGVCASNFKMFPGSNRDATAEQVAQELNLAFDRLKAGDFEVVATIGGE